MSETEYIAVLWRIIYAMGGIVCALCVVVWNHVMKDRKREAILIDTTRDLQKCKDALGINGRQK